MLRQGTEKDIDRVAEIYEEIHDAEDTGHAAVGWARGVYPTRETALAALRRGELFVEEEDGRITAAGILNHEQLPEYADCAWTVEAAKSEVLVLHTLVVSPKLKGHGYGAAFVGDYEARARELDCRALRIDTQEKNRAARGFYGKLGFHEVGVTSCTFNGISGVQLVCLEKVL